jgi:hypothetical protein
MKSTLTALLLAALATAAYAATEATANEEPLYLCIPPAVVHVLT